MGYNETLNGKVIVMAHVAIRLTEDSIQFLEKNENGIIANQINWIKAMYAEACAAGIVYYLVISYRLVGLIFVPDDLLLKTEKSFANAYWHRENETDFFEVTPKN